MREMSITLLSLLYSTILVHRKMRGNAAVTIEDNEPFVLGISFHFHKFIPAACSTFPLVPLISIPEKRRQIIICTSSKDMSRPPFQPCGCSSVIPPAGAPPSWHFPPILGRA